MPTRPKKKAVRPIHYTVMATLFMLTIATFGLSVIMAEVLSIGMVGIVDAGAQRVISRADAKMMYAATKKAATVNPFPLPVPGEPLLCDARWIRCSDACDEQYSDGLVTSAGWSRCERDCDLRALRCEKASRWSDEITVRDTKFAP